MSYCDRGRLQGIPADVFAQLQSTRVLLGNAATLMKSKDVAA